MQLAGKSSTSFARSKFWFHKWKNPRSPRKESQAALSTMQKKNALRLMGRSRTRSTMDGRHHGHFQRRQGWRDWLIIAQQSVNSASARNSSSFKAQLSTDRRKWAFYIESTRKRPTRATEASRSIGRQTRQPVESFIMRNHNWRLKVLYIFGPEHTWKCRLLLQRQEYVSRQGSIRRKREVSN